MVPTLVSATFAYIIGFIAAPPVDIDGIREPVSGSLLYGDKIISRVSVPKKLRRVKSILMVVPPEVPPEEPGLIEESIPFLMRPLVWIGRVNDWLERGCLSTLNTNNSLVGPDDDIDEMLGVNKAFPNAPAEVKEVDEWLLKEPEVLSYSGGVRPPKLMPPTDPEIPPKILEVPEKLTPVSKAKWPLELELDLGWLTDPASTPLPSSDFPSILG